jgi:phosphate starvation-inducible PhoH-like protein
MGRSKKYREEVDLLEILESNKEQELRDTKKSIKGILSHDIKIIAKNESQKKLISSIKNNQITICAGVAGLGKTYVSIAYALNLLSKLENAYKTVYLVKSVTTLKGEELGYIKGDIDDKFAPFLWAYLINMRKIINNSVISNLFNESYIKTYPLAYMRGASLDNCIILVDETQNITLDNARTLLTRIGSDSKIIMLGDTNQIDLKNKKDSSLKILMNILKDIPDIGIIDMNEEDVENIRNPIIKTIEEKFTNYLNNEK